MAERISPDRPLRICDVCGGVDDHARHVLAAGVGEIPVNQENLSRVLADDSLDPDTKAALVADIIDTTTQLRHIDCCRNVGCPDGTCNIILPAHVSLTGAEQLEYITTTGVEAMDAVIAAAEAAASPEAIEDQAPEFVETPADPAPEA